MSGETLTVNGALPRLLLYCSLSVEDACTEARVLIISSAPTLIYGGRGMDGHSYIWFRVGTAVFSRPPYFTAGVNLTAETFI